jgi:TrmH family RNA methyltransferase
MTARLRETVKTIRIAAENAEFQIIRTLKLNRAKRRQLREVFVEGTTGIKQALAAGWELSRIITPGGQNLSDWAKQTIEQNKTAACIAMEDALYRSLCERTQPPEMLATVKIKKPPPPEQAAGENPLLLVLDRPGDLGNLGSTIRSANAFRADAVLVMGHGVDIYEPKVIRASLGSLFFTPVQVLASLESLRGIIAAQREQGPFTVIGTDSTGAVSLEKQRLARPMMLIIGNEAKGMSLKLRELCDGVVQIPMAGQVNSLNASNAASILLWEIYKNRTGNPATGY